MARFSRIEVATKMAEIKLIPIFYHADSEVCKEVVTAVYEGGARVFEFTNRGDFAHEVFAEVNKWVSKELPDMIMGVGSVVDAGTASLYMQLGANFIVSPLLNEDMARCCNRRKVLWSPGCGSLSEIGQAEELGAEIVKIFPGTSVGGAQFVKAIKAPCPWSSIMLTGGVEPTEESLSAWFKAGITCVGMGSNLFPVAAVNGESRKEITQRVKDCLEIINKITNNL